MDIEESILLKEQTLKYKKSEENSVKRNLRQNQFKLLCGTMGGNYLKHIDKYKDLEEENL